MIQDPTHSQSHNRYTYVWNNPTNLTDPTGFEAVSSADTEEFKKQQAAREGKAEADRGGTPKKDGDGNSQANSKNPSESQERAPGSGTDASKGFMGWVHGGLMAGSFAPSFIGAGFSAVDGAIYAMQGDKVDAGISFAAAGVGLVSDAGAAKLIAMGVKDAVTVAKEASVVEKAAADGQQLLYRRGANDSKKLLETQAQAAENVLSKHGVSVSASSAAKEGQVVRSATRESGEAAGFKVTQTGKDLNHHTVELPKPITSEVARIWNDLFK